jgi:hypothetical protein
MPRRASFFIFVDTAALGKYLVNPTGRKCELCANTLDASAC